MVERQNEFGRLFRQARERTGVSLRALAERIGFDASHLFRMEKGERQPSRSSALVLADALSIEGDALDDWLAAAGFAPVPSLASVQGAFREVRTRGGGRRLPPEPGRTGAEESSLVARLEAAGLGEAGIRRLLRVSWRRQRLPGGRRRQGRFPGRSPGWLMLSRHRSAPP